MLSQNNNQTALRDHDRERQLEFANVGEEQPIICDGFASASTEAVPPESPTRGTCGGGGGAGGAIAAVIIILIVLAIACAAYCYCKKGGKKPPPPPTFTGVAMARRRRLRRPIYRQDGRR